MLPESKDKTIHHSHKQYIGLFKKTVLILSLIIFSIYFPTTAVLLLYCIATNKVASLLAKPLEIYPCLSLVCSIQADAIIILGGGPPLYSKETSAHRANIITSTRIRYGAWLQKRTLIPILVTGGNNEAKTMANDLIDNYHTNTQWQETDSLNTWENAMFSKKILQKAGVKKILLVTQANHMPRAVYCFKKSGFSVIPAPTNFYSVPKKSTKDWLPTITALQTSISSIKEYIGLFYYKLKYRKHNPI